MYSIGFDVGSSSVKAALVEKDSGKVISVVKKPDDEMTMKSLNNGWAEQDPFLWWEYVCQSSKELIKKTGVNSNDILTIGIAYQMHGLVIVDENLISEGYAKNVVTILCDRGERYFSCL